MESSAPGLVGQFLAIDWEAIWSGLLHHYSSVTWAFLLDIATDYGVFLVSALGLFVLFAAGQYSLGHAGMVGIAAYASAILVVKVGVPFWPSLPLSGAAGLLAGLVYYYLLGMRLSGFYLAIATFAVGEAMITFWLSVDYFGGALGFHGIPLDSKWPSVLLVVLLVLFGLWRLEKSRFWLAFLAIRESPIVAGAMGVNVARTKMLAWSIGGFITGIGGNLHAHRVTIISPVEFSLNLTFILLLGVLLGGLRTFWGTVAGGAFVYFMPWLTTTDEPRFRLMLYGMTVVLLLVFRPGGLLPAGAPKARTAEDLRRIADKASAKPQGSTAPGAD
jgi:branched-chain amino acid transport system permease protein